MSWISDVRDELERLKKNNSELRKFGFLVGAVFMLLGGAGYFKHWSAYVFLPAEVIGILLLLCGWLRPPALKRLYGIWMALAFALGWLISRLILIFLFYLILTPLGIVARFSGKKFIATEFRTHRESLWIPKDALKKINYEKMV
jgi:Saxitoxin biosynthesis operon protein SxtJ